MIKTEFKKLSRALTHPTFLTLALAGNTILISITVLVYFLERNVNPHMRTYFDSLWWGVSTITTVGFGDVVPMTPGGRVLALILMYTGTVLFVAFTGALVTFWLKAEVEQDLTPLEADIRLEKTEQERIGRILVQINERLSAIEKSLEKK